MSTRRHRMVVLVLVLVRRVRCGRTVKQVLHTHTSPRRSLRFHGTRINVISFNPYGKCGPPRACFHQFHTSSTALHVMCRSLIPTFTQIHPNLSLNVASTPQLQYGCHWLARHCYNMAVTAPTVTKRTITL
jgi:hypothetical protein